MTSLLDFGSTIAAVPLDAWLDWIVTRINKHLQNEGAMRDHAKITIVLAVMIVLEIGAKKNWRIRYGSRNFRIDCLYYVFYYSGLYHVLVFAWIYEALKYLVTDHQPWLHLNLIASMPPAMQIVVLAVASDFFGYWIHRLTHANRYLWAFHSIHHSQTILTAVTNYRFHIVDETIKRLLVAIPILIILGPNIVMWLWVDFIMAWVLLVQHSNWNWSYGHVGRLFVSPLFHRIHHSADEQLQNRNFSMLFSFWDDIFGSAERKAQYPTTLGLAGNPVPETLIGQLVYPFVKIAQEFHRPSQRGAEVVRSKGNASK